MGQVACPCRKENRAPAADDLFRFKFHGLFYVAPAQDSFMLRLRVPGSIISTHQMRGLAELANECGSGRPDITTRSNLQIREFRPKDIVRVLTKFEALGMSSRGSGADNIRNITASPITGIDPDELLRRRAAGRGAQYLHPQLARHVWPAKQVQRRLRQWWLHLASWPTPTTSASSPCASLTLACSSPGIYFRVVLCGITGHKQFASDCGLLLRA